MREALFSSLGDDVVHDAAVLDLYAGSGALAIEALSRGAARAVLVDRDPAAADACSRNLAMTGFDDRGRVVATPVADFLGSLPPPEAPFDLVCCDPPYDIDLDELRRVLGAVVMEGWVAPAARVVLEGPARRGTPPRPDGWEIAWERRYGDTLVSVLRSREQP